MGIDRLLEGFAAPAAPPPAPEFGGAFARGDRVRVPVPGDQSIVGMVRRPHGGSPEAPTHAVIAPEGGGAHVLAPVGDVRLDTPKQFAMARRRAVRQQMAQGAPRPGAPGKMPAANSGINPKSPVAVAEGVCVLLEGFALETPQQSQQRGAAQVATAKKQLAAGWNASKHPRGAGGKFGYTTGGKRATRSSAARQRTLGVGAQGALVKSLQRQLGIPADGIYGPQTQAAVRRYQQQHGLQVDGQVGRQTLASLRGHVNAKSVTPGPIGSKTAPVRVHKSRRTTRSSRLVTSKSRKAQLARQTNFQASPPPGSQFVGGTVV